MRTLLFALALCGCAAPRPASPLRAALDADLRADWDALLAARTAVARLDPGADALYHLAYVDWRLSSLAFVVSGMSGPVPHLKRAVDELMRAVALQPGHGEAQALLAMCASMVAFSDRASTETLRPVARAARAQAAAHAVDSPRGQLLLAMLEFYTPPEAGGDRERGLERWRQSIAMFEKQPPAQGALTPIWGHAEAWAWLGGAYLALGRGADAADALRRALALRPDFWWARVALAQAAHPAPVSGSGMDDPTSGLSKVQTP